MGYYEKYPIAIHKGRAVTHHHFDWRPDVFYITMGLRGQPKLKHMPGIMYELFMSHYRYVGIAKPGVHIHAIGERKP